MDKDVIVEIDESKFVNLKISDVLESRGSLLVMATDSWSGCHELEPCVAKDPPCTGAQTSTCWRGVEVKRGGRPRHLTMGQS
ncbi:hypothetical protein TNCV_1017931 [Trichonephila clavipes]|uniref:Uncharacterized protein n=1 Tax=Trichonephila clavipes TaxID=2585209 RepID=A0A8X6VYH7_TRICX|nr:hypothetical protein TNCV_1017931 [Trichonephila clavipes]